MTPADFWAVTPRETVAVIEAQAWRNVQQQRLGVTAAWFAALFSRQQRLDPLDRTLERVLGESGLSEDEKRQRFVEKMEAARAWGRRHNESLKAQANG